MTTTRTLAAVLWLAAAVVATVMAATYVAVSAVVAVAVTIVMTTIDWTMRVVMLAWAIATYRAWLMMMWTLVTLVTEVVVVIVVIVGMTMQVMVMWGYLVMISTTIEAVSVMEVAMSTTIRVVAARHTIVVVRVVAVDLMDAETPGVAVGLDRTEEIFEGAETCELRGGEDHAEVIVAPVQQVVILVNGILIAVDDVVHDTIDG